jgi:sulfite reductase (NADPH) flavoprotein alpha-component
VSPETSRLLTALAVLLAYLGFCAPFAWRVWRRRSAPVEPPATPGSTPAILVAHASQTGFAEELAQRTAETLRAAGAEPVRLDALDAAALAAARRVLFVVSTTGEGDAPDAAARFVRRVMGAPPAAAAALAGLEYGLLALGDRSYAQYCAFGRRLDSWLRARGATPLFARVEVDGGAEEALRLWQGHVQALGGVAAPWACGAERAEAAFAPWRLVERRVLNPGGLGPPVFRLAFAPVGAGPEAWRAGDIAVVAPRNSAEAVEACLAGLGLASEAPVQDAAGASTLGEALAARRLPQDPAARWPGLRPRPCWNAWSACRGGNTPSPPCRRMGGWSCWCGRRGAPMASSGSAPAG